MIVPRSSEKKNERKADISDQFQKSKSSPQLVNCLFHKDQTAHNKAVPAISRPSSLIWQIPYEERKQLIELDNL